MCTTKLTRSSLVQIAIVPGIGSYTFNVTTFRDKNIEKIEVEDTTGSGLAKSPAGATLLATNIITQSYINLVSSVNTTDNVNQTFPTYRFMPSIGTGVGAGLTNFQPVELSGIMNYDIQNSTIVFPDTSILASLGGQVILINVWYSDYTNDQMQMMAGMLRK